MLHGGVPVQDHRDLAHDATALSGRLDAQFFTRSKHPLDLAPLGLHVLLGREGPPVDVPFHTGECVLVVVDSDGTRRLRRPRHEDPWTEHPAGGDDFPIVELVGGRIHITGHRHAKGEVDQRFGRDVHEHVSRHATDVGVRIDEAGDDRATGYIDDARIGRHSHIAGRPDGSDPVGGDDDRRVLNDLVTAHCDHRRTGQCHGPLGLWHGHHEIDVDTLRSLIEPVFRRGGSEDVIELEAGEHIGKNPAQGRAVGAPLQVLTPIPGHALQRARTGLRGQLDRLE